jgi:hypothetical protein
MNANTDSVSSKWIFEGIVKKLITIVSNASRLRKASFRWLRTRWHPLECTVPILRLDRSRASIPKVSQ